MSFSTKKCQKHISVRSGKGHFQRKKCPIYISGRSDGAVPGHAHVHHVRAAEDRHEGRWTPAGP
jgi:hypothetical protein